MSIRNRGLRGGADQSDEYQLGLKNLQEIFVKHYIKNKNQFIYTLNLETENELTKRKVVRPCGPLGSQVMPCIKCKVLFWPFSQQAADKDLVA